MQKSIGPLLVFSVALTLQACTADETSSPETNTVIVDSISSESILNHENPSERELTQSDLANEMDDKGIGGSETVDDDTAAPFPKPDPLAHQDERRIAPKEVEPSICPDPADCVPLTQISVGHGVSGISVLYNPDLNDPIAQYGDMLGNIMSCAEEGDDMLTCVQSSRAPEPCKTLFESAWSESEGNEIAAFGASFFNPDISCLPEETSE